MSAVLAPRDPGGAPAVVLSLLVHALLFSFLFFGVRWVSKTPDAVTVELWDRPSVPEQVQAEPPPKAEPAPEPKPEPRPEPRVEPKQAKPDIAVQKEKKPPPKKEEPKLRFDRTADIREQADRELTQALSKSAKQAPAQKAAPSGGPVVDAGYANRIKAKIKPNIVLPPDIKGDPEAIFDVVQLPTGDIITVKPRKSSGHRGYDEAVERAILKSSPLPRPDRPEQFVRELQLKFRPQE